MLPPEASADKPGDWQENLNRSLICPDCKEFPPNLIEEFSSGDMVCGSCGLVLGDRIVDTRSEWRTFSNDDQGNDDPSRVGDAENPLLNGSQLTTTIAFGDGNARTRELLRAQAKQGHDKKDKSLLAAYKEIGAHCDAVNIPRNISDSAKYIYKLADDSREFRNKSQDSIIATCIFIACRQANVGRTFKEINALTRVPKKDIGRMFKQMDKFLKDHYAKMAKNGTGMSGDLKSTTSTGAKDLCLRFCSQLGFHTQIYVKISAGLAEKVTNVGELAGRSPLSVAAACIYMASCLLGTPKNPKDIALVSGVSDGTIRTAYKFLYSEREKLIEPEWLGEGKGNMDNLPTS